MPSEGSPKMFARNACAPVAPPAPSLVSTWQPKATHLMLVRTPRLNARGQAWLERSRGEFDALQLQRLIRMEKLSLG